MQTGGPPPQEATHFTGMQVAVRGFAGPLDLLLHLVRSRELDITEVALAQVTDQYLDYLYGTPTLDAEAAGEFLEVASILLLMKSRHLLPRTEEEPQEAEEAASQAGQELVRRLREYSLYVASAEELKERFEEFSRMFGRALTEAQAGSYQLGEVSVLQLTRAFRELLEKAAAPPAPTSPIPTVPEKARDLLTRLRAAGQPLELPELVGCDASRIVIVVCFLALLELIRRGRVRVAQKHAYGHIVVSLKGEDEAE